MTTRPAPGRSSLGASLVAAAVFAAAVTAAALIGVLSNPGTAGDYAALQQPSWAPPSWLFGPVWTVLYAMIALSGWLVWRERGWRGARTELSLYAVQLVLNAAWTPLFFAAGLRGTALVDIVLLVAALSVTIVLFFRVSRWAAALLVPYWAWTVFATALNFSIWQLNTGG